FVGVKDGKVKIEPKYEEAKAFSQGLAPVKVEGKWGFIDQSGTEIIAPTFSFAGTISEEGTAFIQNEAGYALLSFYHLEK
ncbi:MAG: WG repeat-containing protein, partial [Clostridia bacterium]|nr:WG repeat-containing protein [Clostridia bacterium]